MPSSRVVGQPAGTAGSAAATVGVHDAIPHEEVVDPTDSVDLTAEGVLCPQPTLTNALRAITATTRAEQDPNRMFVG